MDLLAHFRLVTVLACLPGLNVSGFYGGLLGLPLVYEQPGFVLFYQIAPGMPSRGPSATAQLPRHCTTPPPPIHTHTCAPPRSNTIEHGMPGYIPVALL